MKNLLKEILEAFADEHESPQPEPGQGGPSDGLYIILPPEMKIHEFCGALMYYACDYNVDEIARLAEAVSCMKVRQHTSESFGCFLYLP
jgi:hypothetical protein